MTMCSVLAAVVAAGGVTGINVSSHKQLIDPAFNFEGTTDGRRLPLAALGMQVPLDPRTEGFR